MVKNNFAVVVSADGCPACDEQKKIIKKHFKGKSAKIVFINVGNDNKNVPPEIKNADGSFSTPTFILVNEGKKRILPGVQDEPAILELLDVSGSSGFGKRKKAVTIKRKKVVPVKRKGRSRFGQDVAQNSDNYLIPQTNVLATYGRNFPNGKGFEIPNSFMNDIDNKFNNTDSALAAGMLGIKNPADLDTILNNSNFNTLRQASPDDPLSAMLYLNRACNINNSPPTTTQYPGLVYDSKNPLTVSRTTGSNTFGRKKCANVRKCVLTKNCKQKKCVSSKKCKETKKCKKVSFGSKLYNQMGDAYQAPEYLVNKNTVRSLYGGGIQDDLPRPSKVDTSLYIGGFPEYKPVKFGKKANKKEKKVKTSKKPKKFIGEGTVLTLKNNKIKIKN
jgi:hypothetical protein